MNEQSSRPADGRKALSLGVEVRADASAGRVLLVGTAGEARKLLASAVSAAGGTAEYVASVAEAARRLDAGGLSLVVVDADLGGEGVALVRRLARDLSGPSGEPWALVASSGPAAEAAIEAVRRGAVDVLDVSRPRAEAVTRLEAALAGRAASAERDRREGRVRALCRRLSEEHESLGGTVGRMCDDLLGAYRVLSEQLDDVALASELNGILRQELEVESLLRTQLEFLLSRVGSTNAGIFLPSREGDYSLGAYINYDMPKETATVTLDELAESVARRFERDRRVVRLNSEDALASRLGESAPWLAGQSVLAVGCHDDAASSAEPECIAVIVLFRRAAVGFSEQAARTLQIAADLFGQQLARVIHIHHRHLPDEAPGGGDDLAA